MCSPEYSISVNTCPVRLRITSKFGSSILGRVSLAEQYGVFEATI
jgi:hypothetical protein